MTTILKGNILHAPSFGALEVVPEGCMVLEDGRIQGIYPALPERYAACPVTDYGRQLIMPSFADMHLHAPQYPMLGMGMDLPLLDWLDAYTFPVEARFADRDYARLVYRQLAEDLISSGTTRVAMFSSRHTDATLILMEELERAGVCGAVGKVNMDRSGGPAQEGTEESVQETLRWLEACRFDHIRPILTPRFITSCTDSLLEALGKLARERDLPVQSHLSENQGEIQLVARLHPDCVHYWEGYRKYGLWKAGTLMAHCVHSGEAEQRAMAESGAPASGAGGPGGPGQRHRRRGPAGHEPGDRLLHPRLQDPADGDRGGIPHRAGGILPGLHGGPPLLRRRKLRPRPAPPRHCGGRHGDAPPSP